MKFLGIDFGTTFTKATIYDTESKKTTLVELNSTNDDFGFGRTKYAMPTAVLVNISPYNRTYEVGIKALNMKLFPGTYCFENFKPALDHEEDLAQNEPPVTYVELVSAILKHAYTSAKLQVLSDFDRIVITVPASTVKGGPRWNRMTEAAKTAISSDIPLDIILEPEAAGFALLDESIKSDKSIDGKTFLIYDLGGGTFDSSVFQVVDEQIFVVGESVGSDDQRRWGGVYIDDLLRKDYRSNGSIINNLVRNSRTSELREQKRVEEMLRMEPTKAKISLSTTEKYIYPLADYTLTRTHFDELVRPMIEETIDCTERLIKSKEQEGAKLSLSDIDRLYLVGGSSKIKIISSIWEQKKTDSNYDFDMEFANIEIVAMGAAKYNALKIDPNRLIELGMIRLYEKDYNRAALYFRNSMSAEGYYLLGLLYFEGLIGNKKNYAKAHRYFKEADTELSNLMMARSSFQGRQGLPRNHESAKEFLKKSGKHVLSSKLQSALESTSPDSDTLNQIYNFDPIEDALDRYNIEEIKKNEFHDRSKREVMPCDPELDVYDLMGWK